MNFNPHEIFQSQSEEKFNSLALKIFHYQYQNNPVYHAFVNHLFKHHPKKIFSINHYTNIPFLPIEFFKTHIITTSDIQPNTLYFESSGTTRQNLSKHYIIDEKIYQQSILQSFQKFYGNPNEYLFIFLLPTEEQRPHSSLIYMAKYLMSFSKYPESGFYLNQLENIKPIIEKYTKHTNTKIFILGLSYALMDLAESKITLNQKNTIVMETGGMKGKREEMPKKFFHDHLKNKLGVSNIHSEYGMTELLSQAYSKANGIFYPPPWMKVLVRDPDDPLSVYNQNKQGIINIIDLANVYSCSFIATADIGKLHNDNSFEILGRSDFSDIRGCNLMYQ